MIRYPALLIAALLVTQVSAAGRKSAREYLKDAIDRADALYDQEKWQDAADAYRRVLFVHPRYGKAKKRLGEINEKFSGELVGHAKKLWPTDKSVALALLEYAHRVDPSAKHVRAAYEEFGYSYHNGAWLTEDEVKNIRNLDRERGEKRRREIGLGPEFKIVRRGVFRFFTDVEGGEHKLKQMMNMTQTHYDAYRSFMSVFPLRQPTEGLDVVLYRDREAYDKKTESTGTAGMYIPAMGASFFFLTGEGDDFNTLLHEMTHQMNHKVLMAYFPRWFEEGIAEYFGHAFVTRGGKSIKLGRATGYRLVAFLEAVRTRDRQVIPLQSFVDSDGEVDIFYAQAWAFTQYLLHGPPPGRLLAHDILAAGVRQRFVEDELLDAKGLARIAGDYGLTLEEIEADFLAYYREGRAK